MVITGLRCQDPGALVHFDGIAKRQEVEVKDYKTVKEKSLGSKKDILEDPVLGAAIGSARYWDDRAALCAELGMDQRPPEQYRPVQTDLPSLIIEGDMDPITPPPNAKAILGLLKIGLPIAVAIAVEGSLFVGAALLIGLLGGLQRE